MDVIRIIQGISGGDSKINEVLYRINNVLHIVHVINKNQLRWFRHVMEDRSKVPDDEIKD